jgi:hypothetical protein
MVLMMKRLLLHKLSKITRIPKLLLSVHSMTPRVLMMIRKISSMVLLHKEKSKLTKRRSKKEMPNSLTWKPKRWTKKLKEMNLKKN